LQTRANAHAIAAPPTLSSSPSGKKILKNVEVVNVGKVVQTTIPKARLLSNFVNHSRPPSLKSKHEPPEGRQRECELSCSLGCLG
jgi:hypothetical protein